MVRGEEGRGWARAVKCLCSIIVTGGTALTGGTTSRCEEKRRRKEGGINLYKYGAQLHNFKVQGFTKRRDGMNDDAQCVYCTVCTVQCVGSYYVCTVYTICSLYCVRVLCVGEFTRLRTFL